MKYNDPFYFAIPDSMPTAQRATVPGHIGARFGFWGKVTFVRSEPGFRLYSITA